MRTTEMTTPALRLTADDVGRVFVTRVGDDVRIIAKNNLPHFCFSGQFMGGTLNGDIDTWSADGRFLTTDGPCDLIARADEPTVGAEGEARPRPAIVAALEAVSRERNDLADDLRKAAESAAEGWRRANNEMTRADAAEESLAALQSRCYEGFASGTDGIFDALAAADKQVAALTAERDAALAELTAEHERADTLMHDAMDMSAELATLRLTTPTPSPHLAQLVEAARRSLNLHEYEAKWGDRQHSASECAEALRAALAPFGTGGGE